MEDAQSLSREEIIKSYRPRVIDSLLNKVLKIFGGVLITGPMWCGKTWTGEYHAKSSISIRNDEIVEYASLNPEIVMKGDQPRLIDEWQEVPKLWDYARGIIDSSVSRGRFIFTGSSLPSKKKAPLHSGAGRFIDIRMRPMSLFESGNSSGEVKLTDLFNGSKYESVQSKMDVPIAMRHVCRGGWPVGIGLEDSDAMMISGAYVDHCLKKDYSKIDGKRRSPATMRSIMESLSRNCATMVKKSVIAADISRDGEPIKEETVETYLAALRGTFVLDEQRSWVPEIKTKARIRGPVKYHFADPSIAAAILNLTPERLVRNPKVGGFFFESLCYRDLSVYASAIRGEVMHYKDNTLEVDSVVELSDGRWGGIEIKQGRHDFDEAAENLLRLKERVVSEPSFLAILTATGWTAYTRDDGVHVIPLDCLGP